jgi:geranylgeranyl diphosphate synthase type II
MGALAGGHQGEHWRSCGRLLGQAYQVADDIADAAGDARALGKPTARDQALGRPNMVEHLGLHGAVDHLDDLILEAIDSIPACLQKEALSRSFSDYASRLCPEGVRRRAAVATT